MQHQDLSSDQLNAKWFLLYVPHTPYPNNGFGGTAGRPDPNPVLPSPPEKLVGYLFVNKPYRREDLLHSIRFVYGEARLENVLGEESIACQMSIDMDAQRYLHPYPLYNSNTSQKKLLELVDNPPKPRLWVWFDWREGCYKGRPAWEDMQKAVERERQEHKKKYGHG